MKYRILGKSGLEVSVIGIGTWQFGGEWGMSFSQPDVDTLLGHARELGINLVDAEERYGDHLSEKLIGQALRHSRKEWIIATKFGHHFHGPFNRTTHWQPDEAVRSVEESLRALQTDTIDLLQFHSGPDEVFDNEALWKSLQNLVQSGKVRYLGISIGRNDNIHQTSLASQFGASTIQVVYNRLDTTPEDKVFPSCLEQNLGVLARVPLASGLLSGKYHPGDTFTDPRDIRSRRDPADIQQQLKRVDQIRLHEVPEGIPMARWALSWCLKHPAVTCVIPGNKTVEQVESNALAADLI